MNEFGKLLKTYREKCRDSKKGKKKLTQERFGELVGREVGRDGYSGAAVSDWERGKSKIHQDDRHLLVSLLKVLHTCGGLLTLEKANGMLEAGNYRSLNEHERAQLFPSGLNRPRIEPMPPQPPPPSEIEQDKSERDSRPAGWPRTLPNDSYYRLPGREPVLDELLTKLDDPNGAPVVTIDGLGGFGKTALAVELTRRLLQQEVFERVVGDSAKQEILIGTGEIVPIREATLDFDSLLNAIANQIGRWELATLKREEKYAALTELLRQNRYLVLVDNLETAQNANALVAHLRGFLGKSRALVTSRRQVRHSFVHTHSLKGLEKEDGLFFIRAEAEHSKVQQILTARESHLEEIHKLTGGAPLAMKLVVAQAQFVPLDSVLRHLRQARGRLYPFIFHQSWQQLSPAAQQILIYIGLTVVTTVSWQELASLEITLNESALLEAINQLVAYSLLNVTMAAGEMRYSIHQLTRQFINSDLPQMW